MSKDKCIICNKRAKRICKVRNNESICSSCCGKLRKSPECLICDYYKPSDSEMPIYKIVCVGDEKFHGKVDIIIGRERADGDVTIFGVLIDFWGFGIKDCFFKKRIEKWEFNSLINRADNYVLDFVKEISLEEAQNLVHRGYWMRKLINLPLPPEFEENKHLLGKVDWNTKDNTPYICNGCGNKLSELETDKFVAMVKDAKPFVSQMEEEAEEDDDEFFDVLLIPKCEICKEKEKEKEDNDDYYDEDEDDEDYDDEYDDDDDDEDYDDDDYDDDEENYDDSDDDKNNKS